ncbi:hypothetical protein FQN54_000192 [Arachnomyces sp. PD_36]|nr:hypothetical protein FQN54_000192 [Arachnomyces sp. PD_36]
MPSSKEAEHAHLIDNIRTMLEVLKTDLCKPRTSYTRGMEPVMARAGAALDEIYSNFDELGLSFLEEDEEGLADGSDLEDWEECSEGGSGAANVGTLVGELELIDLESADAGEEQGAEEPGWETREEFQAGSEEESQEGIDTPTASDECDDDEEQGAEEPEWEDTHQELQEESEEESQEGIDTPATSDACDDDSPEEQEPGETEVQDDIHPAFVVEGHLFTASDMENDRHSDLNDGDGWDVNDPEDGDGNENEENRANEQEDNHENEDDRVPSNFYRRLCMLTDYQIALPLLNEAEDFDEWDTRLRGLCLFLEIGDILLGQPCRYKTYDEIQEESAWIQFQFSRSISSKYLEGCPNFSTSLEYADIKAVLPTKRWQRTIELFIQSDRLVAAGCGRNPLAYLRQFLGIREKLTKLVGDENGRHDRIMLWKFEAGVQHCPEVRSLVLKYRDYEGRRGMPVNLPSFAEFAGHRL